MKYYPVIQRKEILPFATPWIHGWMGLEDTMLSEVSPTKTNTVYHLYVKFKQAEIMKTMCRMVATRGWEMGG